MARSILIAVDFSDWGRAALDAGVALAKDLGARVVLVHALTSLPTIAAQRSDLRPRVEEAEADMQEREAADLTTEWAEKARSQGVEVVPVVAKGDPEDLILKTAEEHDVELIVVGTHGRTGLMHALVGSVAEHVVRKSRRPVMVVPLAEGHEARS